ncbi:MAG: glycosyltransferase family 2 protein [Bacillota bacterium]|nr:glycosyltransferase family 2 protein [Bacillota bacterium]
MENRNVTLSIITPSYNRGHLLPKCYDSLCRQTNQDFEWIVIDDGSQDRTEEIVQSFHPSFPLYFVKKENGGKHTALNTTHPYIHGKYVCILDSDDYFIDTAVAQILSCWEKEEEHKDVGIVILLKGSAPDSPFCQAFVQDEGKSVDIMRYKRECFGSNDACEVIRSDLFKKYPFPVFQNERFISEGALWNRVSFTHKCVYYNQVVYLANYLEDGLSKSGKKLRVHNPNGGMYTANLNMNKKNFWQRRIKNGLLYTCYGFFAKKSYGEMLKSCDSKVLMTLCYPLGFMLYIYWKKKYW